MKIIYNHILPLPGFVAINLFGVIFARKRFKPISDTIINHEAIHASQAQELGGWWRFYMRYLFYWSRVGYNANPFEREAYDNDQNLDYLATRQPNAWQNYLRKC